jgi:hypothetical protein
MEANYPFPYNDYRPPEGWLAKPGYDELLLYYDDFSDNPVFSGIDAKNLIRAKTWSLMPQFDAHVDTDLINGMPDKNMFSVSPVKLEGDISVDLGVTVYGSLEYPTARMFEHMRTAWSGICTNGSLVSPRNEWLSGHPWFSLGSTTHGTFVQCLVDKFSLSLSSGKPAEITWGVVATRYLPQNAFAYQNMDQLMLFPQQEQERRLIYDRDFTIESKAGGVVGHFGLQDASNSIFATGPNKPKMEDDTIINFSIEFNNKLEPQYTLHSTELLDHRKRFEENIFPDCYGPVGQREITGNIEWFGNSNPLTFIEKLMGPGAIQKAGELEINCKFFKLKLKELIWSLSRKEFNLTDKMTRKASFSVASDGWLAIPFYDADN